MLAASKLDHPVSIPGFDGTIIQKMVDSLYGEPVDSHHDLFKIAHTYEIAELKVSFSLFITILILLFSELLQHGASKTNFN